MKGSTPTAADRQLWDALSRVGCIACLHDGIFTPHVSIHHIDGRTKPGAHQKVLPLCGPHHQDQGIAGVIAVHPWKKRFEQEYGSQYVLLEEAKKIAGIC